MDTLPASNYARFAAKPPTRGGTPPLLDFLLQRLLAVGELVLA